ncbi:MAG: prolipoprotein diacylglyceryl transferase [Bacteroidales bacterium]|nr:prolipoprotein diacylglyceryl transferase [Bacteroidales bacterium]MDD2323130.1 prolipoprotein diacylglyceryl transferase [Bacteroidales bacterium]MDD3011741.1 prolipoprotein diacylglyceryl transferase [Bacteroidales bacterium]MDD3960348.1 prolipoprotein diacylglyceryl transferase [Bacteroidales bacterium]MDY0284964.1 prolipoprotein diacylglyceryl transferase [Bacteroidales bacterium]
MILDYITWAVDPRIFPNTGIHVRWYGLFYAIGLYLAYMVIGWMLKKEGKSEKLTDALAIWVIVAAIVGARLGHCFFYEPSYYLAHPWEILMIWKGGLASHGAAVTIPIALFLFARKYKTQYNINLMWLFDRLAVGIPLPAFFIRMGNLMNSEIYGVKTTLPWGFIFERNGETLPKHPTQIYEAMAYLAIFVVLFILYKRKGKEIKPGLLAGLFFFLVFTARFFIEYIKNPQVDFEIGMPLYMGQLLSLPLIIIGIWLIFRKKTTSL